MKNMIAILLIITLVTGCASTLIAPATEGERHASYSYIPFDPIAISTQAGESCSDKTSPPTGLTGYELTQRPMLNSLPDQTVRIAVGQFDSNGSITFGAGSVGYEGSNYQVILDYMNTDTVTGSFLVRRSVARQIPKSGRVLFKYTDPTFPVGKPIPVFQPVPDNIISHYEVKIDPSSPLWSGVTCPSCEALIGAQQADTITYSQFDVQTGNSELVKVEHPFNQVTLPVYVGVGLRLTANIRVLKGNVKLSGLPQIAAAAEANNLTGSLVVQTLGVTGENISTGLPLPSELNTTTIQTAILAMGAIKALLYDDNTQITPRVVGIDNPIGGGDSFTNGVISALSSRRIIWHRPCDWLPPEES